MLWPHMHCRKAATSGVLVRELWGAVGYSLVPSVWRLIMKARVVFFLAAVSLAATSAYAQQPAQGAGRGGQQGRGAQSTAREDGLDPTPVDASTNSFVDKY